MDWAALALGAYMSTIVAILLGAFLPRGVVLTRTPLSDLRDDTYGPVVDRWVLKNDSSVAARILSVKLNTPSGSTIPSPEEGGSLCLDDEVDEITRTERRTPWSKITLGPGDVLIAHVQANQDLEIRYRRKGGTGLLERRLIKVRGGA